MIICANRDEFYQRSSEAMHWHNRDGVEILSGIDNEAGGTWLGVNKVFDFCAVTNIRGANINVDNPRSRGELPISHLTQSSIETTRTFLEKESDRYQPFNLWFGNLNQRELIHFNSVQKKFEALGQGFHAVSNSQHYDKWPKMVRGIENIENVISNSHQLDSNELFNILTDSTQAADHELPKTGVSYEWEKRLSSIFIKSEEYGTRACTVILVDRDSNIRVKEKRFGKQGIFLGESEYSFRC